jgi:hypothetical protein
MTSTVAGALELDVRASGALAWSTHVTVLPGVMSFQHCTFNQQPITACSYYTPLTLTPRDEYSNMLAGHGLPSSYYIAPRFFNVEVCTGAAPIDEQRVLAALYDDVSPILAAAASPSHQHQQRQRHYHRRALLQASDECAPALTDLTQLTRCAAAA